MCEHKAETEVDIENHRHEIIRSTFRNLYLKEKCNDLENENKMLREKVICIKFNLAEKHETNLKLKNDLQTLQKTKNSNLIELDKTQEQIEAILTVFREKNFSIVESDTIDCDLELKNTEIASLQDTLVQLRLREAEKEDLIHSMKRSVRELEKDKEMLTKIKPQTIAYHQEELIMAKGQAVIISEEFKKIKNALISMKSKLIEHIEELSGVEHERDIEGSVSMSFLGALWQSDEKTKKKAENVHEIRTKDLENEVIYLNSVISELQNKVAGIDKQIYLKEEIKRKFQNEIDNARIKGLSNDSILTERRRQCFELENSCNEKYKEIRTSTMQKRQDIGQLARKFDELSNSQNNSLTFVDTSEDSEIQSLEQDINRLKAKIQILQSE